jgi:hypothetical protein
MSVMSTEASGEHGAIGPENRCRSLHSCATRYRHRGEYRFDVADNVVGAVRPVSELAAVVLAFHDRHMTRI